MDFPATMAWLERHKELSMDREWIYELDEKGKRIFQVYVRTSVRPFRRPANNEIAFHYTLEIANIAPPSFFKLLKFEDGIEYGEGGGSRMWEKIAQRREVA